MLIGSKINETITMITRGDHSRLDNLGNLSSICQTLYTMCSDKNFTMIDKKWMISDKWSEIDTTDDTHLLFYYTHLASRIVEELFSSLTRELKKDSKKFFLSVKIFFLE